MTEHQDELIAPWQAGVRAAKANIIPALVLQAVCLCLLLAYYYFPAVERCTQVFQPALGTFKHPGMYRLVERKHKNNLAFCRDATFPMVAFRWDAKFFGTGFLPSDASFGLFDVL